MTPEELKKRTKHFGLRAIRLAATLPNDRVGDSIGRQLIRSATSVGANYRSACRGRSRADFIAKLAIAIEEADEAQYWLEILVEAGIVPENRLADLLKEAGEIVAMLSAASITAKKNMRLSISNQKS
jgi:four helix bundle protein